MGRGGVRILPNPDRLQNAKEHGEGPISTKELLDPLACYQNGICVSVTVGGDFPVVVQSGRRERGVVNNELVEGGSDHSQIVSFDFGKDREEIP